MKSVVKDIDNHISIDLSFIIDALSASRLLDVNFWKGYLYTLIELISGWFV